MDSWYLFFQIPAFGYGRIIFDNFPVTRAVAAMIADDPAGLKMRIDSDSAEKFEAPFSQVFADPVRQSVAYRDISVSVFVIQNGLPA